MNAMLSTNAVSAKYNAMSSADKELVTSLIANIERREKPRRISILGIIGAISMSIPDFGRSRDELSDDEIDELIKSVRAEKRASRDSN